MIPLLVIRPEPGCAASVARARAMGLEADGFPLFAVEPVMWDGPEAGCFNALLVGSANVLRHGGPQLERYRPLPMHVVGEATAQAARAAGFTVAATGSGGLQGVLDRVAPGTRLLRLAGAERIALTPPAGVSMEERTVYAARALPIPEPLADRLGRPAVVMLHSAEAARHFAGEVTRLGLARSAIALAAIGPRVAAAAGAGWAALSTSGTPDEAALLATAKDLCQTGAGRWEATWPKKQ